MAALPVEDHKVILKGKKFFYDWLDWSFFNSMKSISVQLDT